MVGVKGVRVVVVEVVGSGGGQAVGDGRVG